MCVSFCLCGVCFPRWLSGKESACQFRRRRFDSWVRKIPWRREWLPASSSLTWRILWTEEPGGLQSMGVTHTVGDGWAHTCNRTTNRDLNPVEQNRTTDASCHIASCLSGRPSSLPSASGLSSATSHHHPSWLASLLPLLPPWLQIQDIYILCRVARVIPLKLQLGNFPGCAVGKTPCSQCRGPRFEPWELDPTCPN